VTQPPEPPPTRSGPVVVAGTVPTVVRLVAALALIGVPVWVFVTRWAAVTDGHPAYPITLLVAVVLGLLLLRRTLVLRTRPHVAPRSWLRVVAGVGLVVALVLAGGLGWLRPFRATAPAVAAMTSDADVRVSETWDSIEFVPTGQPPVVGLVFTPGGRVDARAYARILRPVAAAGYLVVILKVPYGIAFTDLSQPAGPIARHPEIGSWAVGGHSLGGVTAALYANRHPTVGLLLWASYPSNDLSRSSVRATSIYGVDDGLTTPADIKASKAKLPHATCYVPIPGAVHAFFGDYGTQRGDGNAATTRTEAQSRIAAATGRSLLKLDPTIGWNLTGGCGG
jgi:hypothetical protein